MSFEMINAAMQLSLAIGLIVVGVAFFILAVWPWLVKRDDEERKRHYETELAQIEATGLTAGAMSLLAQHLKQPIEIKIVGDSSAVND